MDELIQRAAEQLIKSKHAITLTGAGCSTESGISDFRGTERGLDQESGGRKKGLSELCPISAKPQRILERSNDRCFAFGGSG